ncbi:hypothetical protein [Planococcus salinus]|uniref:Uncharacterized protein n=1 Tax=Planococcus salinus TaxID=1848460 RepID=A0A3M8PBX1_9BACL|nr:hypothetical protein [Planococcus salinus]RNF41133.1 hypothetical protein EEX84_01935 [Planococcus salinus]
MKLDKFLYLIVHLLTPVLTLVVGLLWGHFVSAKTFGTNVTDNLSVVAIYYVIVSVIWAMNAEKIRTLATKETQPKTR